MKEKIFITGGAGFIGSHIAQSLAKKGYKVIVYDNFSSGKKENLKGIKSDVWVINGDILDYNKLRRSMQGCSFVSHQAAQLEIFRCLNNPCVDLEINTIGTLNVFNAAVKNNIKKVINASSACVYGQAQYTPQDENHPTNPNWPYGVSKLAAEKYSQIYKFSYGLDIVNLRYSIVYGEREWLGRVLTMFIRRVLDNKPPVIFGDGGQQRDFIYVEDAVVLHNLCLFSSKTNNNTYNVSTACGTSIKNLALLVIKEANKKFSPIFEKVEEGKQSKYMPDRKRIPSELKVMVLDNKKAYKELGWRPKISLAEGVRKEIEWAVCNPYVWKIKGQVKV